MTYKLGSLFDGSGGFPLSGSLCGIAPVWAAEVEPYPIAVTRSRFPNMRHLGDISKVNGADIEPVDIITFGSPCQDLSVAGKRAGLKHEANGDEETTRSGLFMEAVRIIKEMRSATNGEYPRFALWENVPGAFSSNKGEDFRIVCEELIKIVEPAAFMPAVPQKGWAYSDSYIGNGWSLAYRVFDAQYWGVPQRRRRIHLIVDFRGQCAREILFEREGVRGYFETGRTPWQATPSHAQGSTGADDCQGESTDGAGGRGRQLDAVISVDQGGGKSGAHHYEEMAPTLTCTHGGEPAVAYTLKVRSGCDIDSAGKPAGKGALIQTEKAATLACVQDQYLFQPTAYSFDSLASNSMKSSNPYSGCREVEVAKTLDTTDPNPSKNQGGIAIVEPTAIIDNIGGQAEYGKVSPVNGTLRSAAQGAVAFAVEPITLEWQTGAGHAMSITEGLSPTLRTATTPAVTYVVENHPADSRVDVDESGKVQTLTSRMGTGGGNVPMVMEPKAIYTHPQSDTWDFEKENRVQTLSAGMGMGGGNTPLVMEGKPTVFDGANVTSPINASNPQPGDPCHTLSTDSRNFLVETVYCLQGNGIDRSDSAGCNGKGVAEDVCYTLNTIDRPAVAFQTYQDVTGPLMANSHPGSYTGQDAFSDMLVAGKEPTCVADHPTPKVDEKGTAFTLSARDYKNPQALAYPEQTVHYIVRRLTPTECARLQGFADQHGHLEQKTDLTEEEYSFWMDVRNTHAAINGKAVKDYTKAQMLTWYNKLWTDAAEYKMWGNGIALPPALYCMQGIMDVLNREEDDSWML